MGTWVTFNCFLKGNSRELVWKQSIQDSNHNSSMDAAIISSGLGCCTMLAPRVVSTFCPLCFLRVLEERCVGVC